MTNTTHNDLVYIPEVNSGASQPGAQRFGGNLRGQKTSQLKSTDILLDFLSSNEPVSSYPSDLLNLCHNFVRRPYFGEHECYKFISNVKKPKKLKKNVLSYEKLSHVKKPKKNIVPQINPFGFVKDLFDVKNDISAASDGISSIGLLAEKLSDPVFAKALTDRMDQMLKHTGDLVDGGLKHSFDVNQFISDLFNNSKNFGLIALCIIVFVLILRGTTSSVVVSLLGIGGFLATKYYDCNFQELWRTLSSNILSLFNVEPQMDFEPAIRIGRVFSMTILTIVFGSQFKVDGIEKSASWLFDRFKRLPTDWAKTDDAFTYILETAEQVCNDFCRLIGRDPTFRFTVDKYPDVTRLCEECSQFIKEDNPIHDLVTSSSERCNYLSSKIDECMIRHKSDRFFQSSYHMLSSFKRKLQELDHELKLRGAGKTATRVPPVCYLFIGKSGIGKSYFIDAISKIALYHMYGKDPGFHKKMQSGQERDYIAALNSAIKHFDGYHCQPVCILDEVLMERDIAGRDTETSEIQNFIKMNNTVPFPLLMADLSRKGMVEFNSQLILGTTNTYEAQIESVTNKEAYSRRWVIFEVDVDPKYGYLYHDHKGDSWYRPDIGKIRSISKDENEFLEITSLSKFLRFRERTTIFHSDPSNKYVSDQSIDMDQLTNRILLDLSNRDKETNLKADQRSFLQSYLNQKISPQMDICSCKVCTKSFSSNFTPDDMLSYSEICGLPFDKSTWDFLVDKFKQGYGSVPALSSDSKIESGDGMCMSKLVNIYGPNSLGRAFYIHGRDFRLKECRDFSFDSKTFLSDRAVNCAKVIGAFAAGFGSIFALYKVFSYLFSNKTSPEIPSNLTSGFSGENFDPQAIDFNSIEVLKKITQRNSYQIIHSDTNRHLGYMTFIVDTIAVIPLHYVRMMSDNYKKGPYSVILRRIGDGENGRKVEIDAKELISNENRFDFINSYSDFTSIHVNHRLLQRHSNIRKYLVSSCPPVKGSLAFPFVDRVTSSMEVKTADYVLKSGSFKYESERWEKLEIPNPIWYPLETKVGDCGLFVSIRNKSMFGGERLFGMHVAGSGIGSGIATPFTPNMFDAIVEHWSKFYEIVNSQFTMNPSVLLRTDDSELSWNDLYQPPEHLLVPGKTNLGVLEAPKVPQKTRIRKSGLYGKVGFKSRTCPARLTKFTNKNGDELDPNAISTTKYHQDNVYLDPLALSACVANYEKKVLPPACVVNQQIHRRVLTYREAVEGIPGIPFLDGIPRSTSAGYPWCTIVPTKGKTSMFGTNGSYLFDTEYSTQVEESVNHLVAAAKKNNRTMIVFMDFPKDERRPIEKVQAGKTRKISACPVHLTIAIRMYFGSFCQFFMANRIQNQSAVGMNVYSSEWDFLANTLNTDYNFIAGDFSNYDGKLPYSVMIRFLDTVSAYYQDFGSENERIRNVLFQDIVNSRHINENGVIYEWVGSNASGNPLTAILNSWCNAVMIRYASLIITNSLSRGVGYSKILDEISDNMNMIVYGDDNVISINPEYKPDLFTQEAFTKAFKVMGLDYTDEDKQVNDDSRLGTRSISEVSFLKRKFLRFNNENYSRKFVCPLALESLMETIQYKKIFDEDEDVVKDNVQSTLYELSMHGKDVFKEWSFTIIKACQEVYDCVPIDRDYDSCLHEILTRDQTI